MFLRLNRTPPSYPNSLLLKIIAYDIRNRCTEAIAMATTVGNGSRSLYGCWTCRLRRKKCDESRPSCSTCASLELYCHGFGPRPQWMDRGVLQKQKALEVKQILRHIKSTKFRRQSIQTVQQLAPQINLMPLTETSSANVFESSPVHGACVVYDGVSNQESLHDDIITRCFTTFDMPMRVEPYCNDILTEDFSINQNDAASAYDLNIGDNTGDNTGDENLNFECSALPKSMERVPAPQSLPLGGIETPTQGGGGFYVGKDGILEASILEYNSPWDPTSTNQDKSDLTLESLASAAVGSTLPDSWFVDSSNSILCSGTEDTLFMHYLDKVFYIQYPFYDSSKGGRGWLFSILRRVKSAYYAVLALSDYHLRSCQLNSTSSITAALLTKSQHYDLAIQEMRLSVAQANTWSGSTVSIRSMENLTSILQFLYWEVS
ncbi:hypothetical protein NHQ30_002534 [Ciborinia camelliae]|nr:hypothetical protein NHQ30_002534 [Ciborinia camelliae]